MIYSGANRRRNRPRRWSARVARSTGHYATAGLCILAQLLLITGLPVPPSSSTGTALSALHPCRGQGCGCEATDQWWYQDCCCMTREQKKAWAEAHQFPLPPEVPDASEPSASTPQDVALPPCCQEEESSCCATSEGSEAPVATNTPATVATATKTEFTVEQTTTVGMVLTRRVLRCRGIGTDGIGPMAVDLSLASPAIVFAGIDVPERTLTAVSQRRPTSVSHPPPTPPPRPATTIA